MTKYLNRSFVSFVFAFILSLIIGYGLITGGILVAGRGNGFEIIRLSEDPQLFRFVLIFYAVALLFLLLSGVFNRAMKKRKALSEA